MTSEIKLIAIDMDGTLLNEKNEITDNTQKILKNIAAKGVHIALATGRVYVSVKSYKDLTGIPFSIACTNGSLAFDEEDKEIYYKPLNGFQLETTLNLLETEDIYFHLYTRDGLVTPYGDHPKASIVGRMPKGKEHLMKQIILPMEELKKIDETIYKIIIIENDNEKRRSFRKKLDEAGISTSSSWHNNIEITDEQANKKEALQRILHRYSLEWEEVIAFGDNENDLPMLHAAGQAYLMGNASDELKQSVDFPVIKTNREEGVYHQLKELFEEC
ncbi:MAG: Cof-type HAD-IIB family hydrolase [Tissierellia bacterium]|nr:Cof-type HAD-IIB family hydrolase [Tissierellia bacterium]